MLSFTLCMFILATTQTLFLEVDGYYLREQDDMDYFPRRMADEFEVYDEFNKDAYEDLVMTNFERECKEHRGEDKCGSTIRLAERKIKEYFSPCTTKKCCVEQVRNLCKQVGRRIGFEVNDDIGEVRCFSHLTSAEDHKHDGKNVHDMDFFPRPMEDEFEVYDEFNVDAYKDLVMNNFERECKEYRGEDKCGSTIRLAERKINEYFSPCTTKKCCVEQVRNLCTQVGRRIGFEVNDKGEVNYIEEARCFSHLTSAEDHNHDGKNVYDK